MWSEGHLSPRSQFFVFLIAVGFILLAGGFVVSRLANLPEPFGAPFDPSRYYEKQIVESYAILVAGLGTILVVAAMVFLGLIGRELNPQVRRALMVGGGLLLIGFGLLFAGPSYYLFG